MARTLTIVAVGLIVLGAMAMVGPTFGFSTVASDRGVSITTAETSNALLQVETTDNVVGDDDTPVIEMTNNFNSEISIDDGDVEVYSDGGNLNVDDLDDSTLQAGDSLVIYGQCGGGQDSGTATIQVENVQASGGSVTVNGVSQQGEIDYNCGSDSVSGGDGLFSELTAEVTTTQQDNVESIEFHYTYDGELEDDEEIEFKITYGPNDNMDDSVTTTDTSGTITLDDINTNHSDLPVQISAEVDGTGCSKYVDSDGSVELCG